MRLSHDSPTSVRSGYADGGIGQNRDVFALPQASRSLSCCCPQACPALWKKTDRGDKDQCIRTLNVARASLHYEVRGSLRYQPTRPVNPTSMMGFPSGCPRWLSVHRPCIEDSVRVGAVGNVLGQAAALSPSSKSDRQGQAVTVTHPKCAAVHDHPKSPLVLQAGTWAMECFTGYGGAGQIIDGGADDTSLGGTPRIRYPHRLFGHKARPFENFLPLKKARPQLITPRYSCKTRSPSSMAGGLP